MKTIALLILGALAALELVAQDLESGTVADGRLPAGNAATAPQYVAGERGPNHKVWNKVTRETDADGRSVLVTNEAYVEIQSGMHYMEGEKWLEASEEIELAPGWAVMNRGAHRAAVSYNLNSAGSVVVTMPDGKVLRSHVLGLYFIDSSTGKSVRLADVKDSDGKVLPPNQVVFSDAFTEVSADVRYTYRKAGFEQDIILRQQPPSPAAFGLNPETTRLAVLTEFLNPPAATLKSRRVEREGKTGAFKAEEDMDVSFGSMQIGRGRAFALGAEERLNPLRDPDKRPVSVTKRWIEQDNRHFLLEEVPLKEVDEEIAKLPKQAGIRRKAKRSAIAGMEIPGKPGERISGKKMEMASAATLSSSPGYVLDYFLIASSTNDVTFEGDKTYYISGWTTIGGKITFEGGSVIKFSPTNSAEIYCTDGDFDCKTAPYRPCIMTARDDDTVGEVISGSSGVPTNFLCALHIPGPGTPVLKHLKITYVDYGISVYSSSPSLISDVQFVKNSVPLSFHFCDASVRNCLFDRSSIPLAGMNYQYSVENATFSSSSQFSHTWTGTGGITMTNCIAVGLTNWGNASSILTNNSLASLTPMPSLFQSIGAGNFYLATNSPYRNAGWTNIDATLLAELGKKTTYPPVLYSNAAFWTDATFAPQAQRNLGIPDLGYHYNPIDYLVSQVTFSNAVVVFTNGVVIGCLDESGIIIRDGSSVESIGTALRPNWFVTFKSAQEQPIKLGSSLGTPIFPYQTNENTVITGKYHFTKFATIASGSQYLFYHYGNWNYDSLQIRNCEFWNGSSYLGGTSNTSATIVNNLYRRAAVQVIGPTGLPTWLAYSNNLNSGGVLRFWPQSSSNCWSVINNAFDNCRPTFATQYVTDNGYNAYYNSTIRLYPTNNNDLLSTNSLAYEGGALGDFYLPANSALIDAGSTTADLVGLYHFTTQTNANSKEYNSTADIGYHYVGVDGNNAPIDSDGDGIPDYLEDTNGNSYVDSGETDWNSAMDVGLRVIITRPRRSNLP